MRPDDGSAEHLAPEDVESISATEYLLRRPENARRLTSAITRLESGGGVVHELDELD